MKITSLLMRSSIWIFIFLCLLQVSPLSYAIWHFDGVKFVEEDHPGASMNGSEVLNPGEGDLDGNGQKECVELSEGSARITDCKGDVYWQSAASWQVKQAFVSDLNRDGNEEVTLLVWRPFRSWPIDSFLPSGGRIDSFHDRDGMSCHLVLIGWDREGFDELWAGSALIRPIERVTAVDLDNDGWQELVALESQYDTRTPGGTLTAWRWRGFGFVLLDEVKQQFTTLNVFADSSAVWVITR